MSFLFYFVCFTYLFICVDPWRVNLLFEGRFLKYVSQTLIFQQMVRNTLVFVVPLLIELLHLIISGWALRFVSSNFLGFFTSDY